jgi:mevalonate kinase
VAGLWPALREGGPWAALLFLAILAIAGFAFALSRGILVRGSEVDRIERRIEKDTDRVIDLYKEQIKTLNETISKKDATIEKQADQIGKLLAGSTVATEALDKIVKEAERRGHLPT